MSAMHKDIFLSRMYQELMNMQNDLFDILANRLDERIEYYKELLDRYKNLAKLQQEKIEKLEADK